ncbi:MAG: hypothetical protein CME00_04425 [Geminicoccus sp.]|nr:hypothetical protein [Geminicoccus sp.]
MTLNRRSVLKIAASGGAAAAGATLPFLPSGVAQAALVMPGASRGLFDLFQGKKAIGQHGYEISGSQTAPAVMTQAAFEGRVLAFSARYELATREQWQDGRLQQLQSHGSFRNDPFWVRAERQGSALVVTNERNQVLTVAPDILPTTYWMPNFIEQRAVLDTQRGQVLTIAPQFLGEGSFHGTTVRGWELGGELGIKIYYDLGNSWAGLQFRVLGSSFEYRRVG